MRQTEESIKDIENEIISLQGRISILEERKVVIEKMSKLLKTFNLDEKQALFELLQEQSFEGELSWSQ